MRTSTWKIGRITSEYTSTLLCVDISDVGSLNRVQIFPARLSVKFSVFTTYERYGQAASYDSMMHGPLNFDIMLDIIGVDC